MFIIIAGAGIIGSQVAHMLVQNKHNVVVIDLDRDVCETIYAETGAMTIHGNATRIKVLEEAGVKRADTLLCLMRNDADNISCALLAKSLGIENIIVRLRKPQYEQAYKIAGVNSIVDISELLLDRIIIEVEKPKVRKVFTVGVGKASVYAVHIPEDGKVVGKKIYEIAQDNNFPDECVFMGIFRKDEEEIMIPRGNHVLKANDLVFIFSKSQLIKVATDYLTKTGHSSIFNKS